MYDLRSMSADEMNDVIADFGEPKFRSKQLFTWIHNKQITGLTSAHNLSKKVINSLIDANYDIDRPCLARRQISKDGTEKYLFQLHDGQYIESVLMKYRGDYSKQRNTLCVSSQVGCAMGCRFCATGARGYSRNLSVGEIISQVYEANALLKEDDEPMQVRNIVFMGMGEPFANFDNVLKAINILCDPLGADLARRRITISTCGLIAGIRKLADLQTDIGLAISLHASNQKTRADLMPVARTHPLDELISACHYYGEKTGRRISFEYALIAGVNDKDTNVQELVSLLRGLDCHINLIPVNPVGHVQFKRPSYKACRSFQEKLQKSGLGASIREAKGEDIDGACGQLRAKELDAVVTIE